MAATVRDRIRAHRQRKTLSLPDGPAKTLARVKVILRTYPASYRGRLDNVLTKFEGEVSSVSGKEFKR